VAGEMNGVSASQPGLAPGPGAPAEEEGGPGGGGGGGGRGLHSSTFRLNVSAFCKTWVTLGGCSGGV